MLADAGRQLVRRITATRSTTPLLPWVPKYLKVLFLLLVLLNSSSFPFLWHIRVWYHPLRAYLIAHTRGHKVYWRGWRKKYVASGGIARMRAQTWRRAQFDDCDYNLHLSNSAYAKASDANKMKFCIDAFAPCFVTGLHMALGASHWQYLREIPMGSQYLMESRIGGWGDKWIHVVTEFVIYPRKGKAKHALPAADKADKPTVIPDISNPPSGSDSGIDTPERDGTANSRAKSKGVSHDELMKLLMVRAREPRADGGIVTCIAITDYCFKQGRITIPPRIAMHMSLLSPDEERRKHAMNLLTSKDKGASFVRGGWKTDPLVHELGRDIGLGEDGTQQWAMAAKDNMDGVGTALLQVALASP